MAARLSSASSTSSALGHARGVPEQVRQLREEGLDVALAGRDHVELRALRERPRRISRGILLQVDVQQPREAEQPEPGARRSRDRRLRSRRPRAPAPAPGSRGPAKLLDASDVHARGSAPGCRARGRSPSRRSRSRSGRTRAGRRVPNTTARTRRRRRSRAGRTRPRPRTWRHAPRPASVCGKRRAAARAVEVLADPRMVVRDDAR